MKESKSMQAKSGGNACVCAKCTVKMCERGVCGKMWERRVCRNVGQ